MLEFLLSKQAKRLRTKQKSEVLSFFLGKDGVFLTDELVVVSEGRLGVVLFLVFFLFILFLVVFFGCYFCCGVIMLVGSFVRFFFFGMVFLLLLL